MRPSHRTGTVCLFRFLAGSSVAAQETAAQRHPMTTNQMKRFA